MEPLSASEEALWRAVMRIVKVLPRHLDSDLIRGAGLTASEYTTIMHLSEAPNRELRMADLASATDLSASRMTRLVDDLQSRGLVTKTASSSDARGNVARLTPRGMAKLKSAWPVHLASVRRRFFDCIDPAAVEGSRGPWPRWLPSRTRLSSYEGGTKGRCLSPRVFGQQLPVRCRSVAPAQSPLRSREVSTMSTTSGTVSVLAQSRCSSQASDTQPMGCRAGLDDAL